jgi:hypothetical protein
VVQTHCLTHLPNSYWMSGEDELTRYYVPRPLQLANTAKMPQHIATAQANPGWLAWCEGGISGRQRLRAWLS